MLSVSECGLALHQVCGTAVCARGEDGPVLRGEGEQCVMVLVEAEHVEGGQGGQMKSHSSAHAMHTRG